MNSELMKWFEGLTEGERAALLSNKEYVQRKLYKWAAIEARKSGLLLDYTGGPGLIQRLLGRCGTLSGQLPIEEGDFPLVGTGIVTVRYRDISRQELLSRGPADSISRNLAETKFREMGLRFCRPEEALLVLAEDRLLVNTLFFIQHPWLNAITSDVLYKDGSRETDYWKLEEDSFSSNWNYIGVVCE